MRNTSKQGLLLIWNKFWIISLVSLVVIWAADLVTSAAFIKLGYPQLEGNATQRLFVTDPSLQNLSAWLTAQWSWFVLLVGCLVPPIAKRLFGSIAFANMFPMVALFATWFRLNYGVSGNLGTIIAIKLGWTLPISDLLESELGFLLVLLWLVSLYSYSRHLIKRGESQGVSLEASKGTNSQPLEHQLD